MEEFNKEGKTKTSLRYLLDKMSIIDNLVLNNYNNFYKDNSEFINLWEDFQMHRTTIEDYNVLLSNLNSSDPNFKYGIERDLTDIESYLENLLKAMDRSTLLSEYGFVGIKKNRGSYFNNLEKIELHTALKLPLSIEDVNRELSKKYPGFEF